MYVNFWIVTPGKMGWFESLLYVQANALLAIESDAVFTQVLKNVKDNKQLNSKDKAASISAIEGLKKLQQPKQTSDNKKKDNKKKPPRSYFQNSMSPYVAIYLKMKKVHEEKQGK